MSRLEDHCVESARLFGNTFEEVHRWLDEFAGSPEYGFRHRKKRHHEAGIREAAVLFESEAAFEVVLAASLVRSYRAMNDPDWIGSVLSTTWKSSGISLLVSLFGVLVIHSSYPQVARISEFFRQLMKSI